MMIKNTKRKTKIRRVASQDPIRRIIIGTTISSVDNSAALRTQITTNRAKDITRVNVSTSITDHKLKLNIKNKYS